MRKYIYIFFTVFYFTTAYASEKLELLSNAPQSLIDSQIFREIDFTKATKYKSYHIPYRANPNLSTLQYYFYRDNFTRTPTEFNTYSVLPSKEPYEFSLELIENKTVKKQMETKPILSYLFFEGDKIIIDEMSPKEKFGKFMNNETKLRSQSMGKSLVSYVLGHAICEGYIESIDSKISDWNLVKDTLYENHSLIDILNMASGDQKYVYDSAAILKGKVSADYRGSGADIDPVAVQTNLNFYFKNKLPSKKKYNYNVMNTNLILNYVLFKTGDEFQNILDKTFKEKAKIKYPVYFYKKNATKEQGNADPMFYATRYDYLRIAKAIMDDYQKQNCVGKYLKEIYDRRIPKNINHDGMRGEPLFNRTKSYGGQFHLNYPGLKNKIVFGMGGYGGKAILIDVEDSRIVILHSQHFNNKRFKYSVRKLLIDPIKKGFN
jgi:CubicO group peptidase (beta-lactamase class C family)